MSQEDIEKSLRNCLKENVSNVLSNSTNNNVNNQKVKRQSAKQHQAIISSSNSNTQVNNFSSISSQEYMENVLKDKLFEIEGQIFSGAIGHLKIDDRNKWKEALQSGKYDPQCVNLTWGDLTRPALEVTNSSITKHQINSISSSQYTSTNDGPVTPEVHAAIVNNLAKVLLQIEQSVEKRFLRTPLGDTLKTPDKKRETINQVVMQFYKIGKNP